LIISPRRGTKRNKSSSNVAEGFAVTLDEDDDDVVATSEE